MAQPFPHINQAQANNIVDGVFGDDGDDKYHIPIDVTHYTTYNNTQLVPNVVYYETERNPDGSYYYINNSFKGVERGGETTYENKHGDNLKIELRPPTVIFLKAYDVHRQDYLDRNLDETDFLSIVGIDDDLTDMDESENDYSDDSDMDGGRRKKSLKKFHFSSTQKHQHGGKKTVRNVTIRHGKGHKKVTYYKGNKKVSTVKKPLKSFEIELIKIGKFIPGLFKDCGCGKKHRTRRHGRKMKK